MTFLGVGMDFFWNCTIAIGYDDNSLKGCCSGLYFVGVNMPDHDVIFSQLATELKNQITPFVAVLTSKDCAG